MKKLLTLTCLSMGLALGYAQGTVDFANSAANFTTAPSATPGVMAVPSNGHDNRLVYYTDNTTALIGTNWVAQLYFKAGSNQSEGSLAVISGDSATPFRATSGANNGAWANTGTMLNGQPVTVSKNLGVAYGSTVTLQVRVWDGSLYGSYAAAIANPTAITGKSVTFNYSPTDPSTLGYSPDKEKMYGLQSFTLQAAPEPSTIALGVLGAASLLIVRRRK